jgi:probable rRNA maturation factor
VDPDSRRLHVSVTDGSGRRIRDGGLARWLTSVAPATACGELAVALVRDSQIRALNRQHRRKSSTTDVLAFPTPFNSAAARRSRLADRQSHDSPRRDPRELGDIVIATGVARRQAREAGHPYQTELRVLALHGLLHLLGYDHHNAKDARRMARAEARLRRRGGLRAGLIERAERPPALKKQ